jgi:hypothetical protein
VVGLDEAHSTHVSGKIENLVAPSNYLSTVVVETEIYKMELIAEDVLLQVIEMGGFSQKLYGKS